MLPNATPLLAWVVLILATVLFVEALLRLRLLTSLTRYKAIAAKSYRLVTARHVSEHRKEKVLPVYARQLLICSAELLGKIVTAAVPGVIIGLALIPLRIDLLALAGSGVGLMFATVVGLLFAFLRTKHEHHPL